ncbi:MAG: hypothetical protein AAGA96_18485 [Verrucomicrobiota bacterium]
MKWVRNFLAVVGFLSIVLTVLAVCWWNGFFASSSQNSQETQFVENPSRSKVAHHTLTEADEIIFQGETYDDFFGDGGGTVIVRLAAPLDYSSDAWHPIADYPQEFLTFAPMGDGEHSRSIFESPDALWSVIHLKRSGERISNLVVAFYDPQSRIIIERIFHT